MQQQLTLVINSKNFNYNNDTDINSGIKMLGKIGTAHHSCCKKLGVSTVKVSSVMITLLLTLCKV